MFVGWGWNAEVAKATVALFLTATCLTMAIGVWALFTMVCDDALPVLSTERMSFSCYFIVIVVVVCVGVGQGHAREMCSNSRSWGLIHQRWKWLFVDDVSPVVA